jgi:hypothetical protein
MTLFPQEAAAYIALAAAWLADRKATEGEKAARHAIELDPASADAHYVLGTALEMRRSKRAAQLEYDRAVELDPGHASAAERIWSSARGPAVVALGIVAYAAVFSLRILGGRFTDRIVAVLLLLVTAAFVVAVLVGLREQRRRLARLSPYARIIVGLESTRRWSQGVGQLFPAVIVVTAVVVGLSVVTVLYAIGEKSTLDIRVGDCFSYENNTTTERISVIPCQLPHDVEVFAVLADPSPPGAAFPGLDPLRTALLPRCIALYPGYVGVPFGPRAPAQILAFVPEYSFWVLDIRLEFCGLSNPSGGQLTGSLRANR